MLEYQVIAIDINRILQIDPSLLPFQIDNSQAGRFWKRKDGKWPTHGGMRTNVEWQHLNRDIGQLVAGFGEVAELLAHHGGTAYGLVQRSLTHDHPEPGRLIIEKDPLPDKPRLHELLLLFGSYDSRGWPRPAHAHQPAVCKSPGMS